MTPTEKGRLSEQLAGQEMPPGVERLWEHFVVICGIPRKTGSEGLMIEHITGFANERGLPHEIDEAGNVFVEIPATDGFESVPGIIFQGHLDMVCAGSPDPATYGVKPRVVIAEGKTWVQASNTTLGADNGVGISGMLALADEEIPHGPIALMFTVHEEVGIKGAMAMSFKTDMGQYRYLVNVDSEDEGEATIGSAGGGDTIISVPYKTEPIGDKIALRIAVNNLMSGHSGVEIGEARLNGVKVLAETLRFLSSRLHVINLVSLRGGEARNAIPSAAEATIAVDPDMAERIPQLLEDIRARVLERSKHEEEKALTIGAIQQLGITDVMPHQTSLEMVSLLSNLPDGVLAWNKAIPGLPETSANLAIIGTDKNQLRIELMTRSSKTPDLEAVRKQIADIAQEYGGTVTQTEAYPGWPAHPEHKIVRIVQQAWNKVSGSELIVGAIHAGLESPAVLSKHSHLEAISVGPTVKDAHTTRERVDVDSVTRYYQLLQEIVKAVASEANAAS